MKAIIAPLVKQGGCRLGHYRKARHAADPLPIQRLDAFKGFLGASARRRSPKRSGVDPITVCVRDVNFLGHSVPGDGPYEVGRKASGRHNTYGDRAITIYGISSSCRSTPWSDHAAEAGRVADLYMALTVVAMQRRYDTRVGRRRETWEGRQDRTLSKCAVHAPECCLGTGAGRIRLGQQGDCEQKH